MPLAYVLALVVLGLLAGSFGALLGLGGGVIIVPALTLLFDMPIQIAVGTSLVCVIATSSAAAAVYVQRQLADTRLGVVLELGPVLGAITGAVAVTWLSQVTLQIIFAVFLFTAALLLWRRPTPADLPGGAVPDYQVRNYPLGMGISYLAGGVSGMLGIGGGPIKVPLMYLAMGVPIKVAAATSNFMIGVTATASAFLYYHRGSVVPALTAPVVVGVFLGALLGSRWLRRVESRWVQGLLLLLLLYLAVQMLRDALPLIGAKL
ncbi:MAG: sulfite exporter TauE/SafE family protein [Terriglobia bacterium]